MESEYLTTYFNEFIKLATPTQSIISDLIDAKRALLALSDNNKKCIIIGNGGSAAIASHFSIDLTKNTNIPCINFNEASLLTCFSNDYGYEKWAEKAVEFYGCKGDLLIAISSSGESDNIINACNSARAIEFSKIITLSGFDINNRLNSIGDITLYVNSKMYNYIENLHQIWLLSLVDLIHNE